MSVRPTCHPERPYRAKGKCGPCYRADFLMAHPERLLCKRGHILPANRECRECRNLRARAYRRGLRLT